MAAAAAGAGPATRTKEFNKYKLVFVGDSQVGKTSVIGRYVYGVFNECYQNTVGIDFLSKSIRLEGRAIRLQLWDTAGQERFRALIPSYIRDASAVMVVYDITNRTSFANISTWIDSVREQQGSDALILVVGNKADLAENRQVSTEEGEEMARKSGMMFFEVSAKSGEKIEELFEKLVAALPAQAPQHSASDREAPQERNHKLTRAPAEADGKSCQC